jgi:glutamyl-tRNA synthetase
MIVRTRYAPSPTGFQHIGGIRTALYCYLFAKKNNGTFILRIEDTDQGRLVPEAEQYIIDALAWAGIQCDEGVHVGGPYAPYRQSDRKEIYKEYVQQLIDNGHAYYAFDTPKELDAMRASEHQTYSSATRLKMRNSLTMEPSELAESLLKLPFVVRIKIPADQTIVVNDLIRGEVVVSTNEMDDKVLLKADGMPTYHLANVVDDRLMKITHVIRGEEWLPSTPLHVFLYRCFGWEAEMPKFSHLSLLLKPEGNGKLSKRDGDKLGFPVFPLAWKTKEDSSNGYREMGFIPEAFINMLALLGWNSGTEQELFTMDELIASFSLERIIPSGAKFDFEKAKWFNQQYIKAMSDGELVSAVKPFYDANLNGPIPSDDSLLSLAPLLKERMVLLPDFWEQSTYFFKDPTHFDFEAVRKKWNMDIAEKFMGIASAFDQFPSYTEAELDQALKAYLEVIGIKAGDVLLPLRIMLTGAKGGPNVLAIAAFIGREATVRRIKNAVEQFNAMA